MWERKKRRMRHVKRMGLPLPEEGGNEPKRWFLEIGKGKGKIHP